MFCLSLMGTNYLDFIEEAFRILKQHGTLWIAEVKSRVMSKEESSSVNDDAQGSKHQVTKAKGKKKGKRRSDSREKLFIEQIEQVGFKLQWKDVKNSHFVLFQLKKVPLKGDKNIEANMTLKNRQEPVLLPCIYKRR